MLETVEGKKLSVTFLGARKNTTLSPNIARILRKMEKSVFDKFYLTGSFSVSGKIPDDIDFFCCYTEQTKAALLSYGFCSEFSAYGDSSFQEVLIYQTDWNLWGDEISQIHVQLIYPWMLDRKIVAQKQFEKLSPYLKDLSKDRMRSLWEILTD